jgi:hypothetical protein
MTSKGLGLNAGAASFTPTVLSETLDSTSASYSTPQVTIAAAVPARDAGVREDSFSEYAEMMDNIENALEDEAHNDFAPENPTAATDNHNFTRQTVLPPHLQKHAQEFWFPECRDCSCCNGFKHGCLCAASNGGVCLCTTGGTRPASGLGSGRAAAGAAPGGGRPVQAYAERGISSNSFSGGRGRGGGGRGRVPCKFFFSQSGCRYGDSCTFSHQR